MLDPYIPLVLMFALALGFAVFSVSIAPLVGPRRFNRAKLDAYECGIEPSPTPVVGGGRMPVAYYLTAMMFILFDIEMVFLFPYAVSADALGMFGVDPLHHHLRYRRSLRLVARWLRLELREVGRVGAS